MKFVTIITAIMSVAAATAISAELQERQCIPNGCKYLSPAKFLYSLTI